MTAFASVAERRSFSKAAIHLGISRATISQRIRALEDRLGVRLFNRTTRNVALTEAGERLLARLRPALAQLDIAVEEIHVGHDRPAGHLRLTVVPTVANMVLAPLVARFLEQYPEIKLEISVSHAPSEIVSGRFDAGIRHNEQIERDMIAVRISDDVRPVVTASPDYLARHPPPRMPRDLHAHNCIRHRLPDGSIGRWRFMNIGKRFEVTVDGSLVVSNFELLLRAVLDGAGIGYMPPFWAEPYIRSDRLVSLLDEWVPFRSGFFLYYPSRRLVPPSLKALIRFLRNEIGQGRMSRRHLRVGERV